MHAQCADTISFPAFPSRVGKSVDAEPTDSETDDTKGSCCFHTRRVLRKHRQ